MTGWINVKDRLPEIEGAYLCIVKNSGIRIREFRSWITGSRMRFWCNGAETKKVTHWMPLPEPPSDEEKK